MDALGFASATAKGLRRTWAAAALMALACIGAAAEPPQTGKPAWSYATAAQPYRGVTINASFMPRPGYEAAIALIPEFERLTGIHVTWESIYYEKLREALVLDFTGGGKPRFDVVLIDIVWPGEFATAGWIAPLRIFYRNPAITDPDLDLKDFFPILLTSVGTWDQKLYGLPFDNYSGLLFYNKCQLKEAGFDRPPATWNELRDVYGPALTKGGRYAYALQSHQGETQSCDSFMRFVWPFGGSLLTEGFEPNLSSPESLAGLKFRQSLMRYMPPAIVDWEHEDVVKALGEGQVAMITEWSGWYKWLADPKTSKISQCLAVAAEPAGPVGRKPALGGFSLGVNARSSPDKQAAAWLFIQWITSKQKAADFIMAGGVPGRRSAYKDEALKKRFPYFEPLVNSWEHHGNAIYRPRFQEWPTLSRIISTTGTEMMRGNIGVEAGAKQIDDQVHYILHESGYYGTKPKLQ
ncbi:MAG TPA: sugar ABC transporter substrate-binding protein [Rhodocyclaceae bacterium]|nr:sugar ABC transporter substrate-binding protein [Rhodocyclaceae bacterium]